MKYPELEEPCKSAIVNGICTRLQRFGIAMVQSKEKL